MVYIFSSKFKNIFSLFLLYIKIDNKTLSKSLKNVANKRPRKRSKSSCVNMLVNDTESFL